MIWNLLLDPKTHTYYHLLNIDWLITDVTAVGSPIGTESEVFWATFDIFLVVLRHFCGPGAN